MELKNEQHASIWPLPLSKEVVRHQKLLTLSSTEFQRMRKDRYYSPNSCEDQKALAGSVGRRLRGVIAMETEGAHENEALKYAQETLGAGYIVVKNHLVWIRNGNNSNPDAVAFNKKTGRLVPIEIKAPRLNREVRRRHDQKALTELEYATDNKAKINNITNEAIDQVYHAMYVLNATEGYIITVEQRMKLVSNEATGTPKEVSGELCFHMTPTIRPSAIFTDNIITDFCKNYNAMLVSGLASIACNGIEEFSKMVGETYPPSVIQAYSQFKTGFLNYTLAQASSVMAVILQRVIALKKVFDEDKKLSLSQNIPMTLANELFVLPGVDSSVTYALRSVAHIDVGTVHRARFMNEDTFPFRSCQTSYASGSVRANLIDQLETYTTRYTSLTHEKHLPK
jgi:hypothetical protein